MAWKIRRSVKIAPGVRVNFNKKSTSVTFSGKNHRATYTTSRKRKSGFKAVPPSPKVYRVSGSILQITAIVLFVLSLLLLLVFPAALIFTAIAVFFFVIGRRYKKKARDMVESETESEQ